MSAVPASFARTRGKCAGCGRDQTADEAHYYGASCEACERQTFFEQEQAETVPNAGSVNQQGPFVNANGADVKPVRLVLGYPISANRYWATRVIRLKKTGKWTAMTYVTPEAEAYKQEVERLALTAGVRKPLEGRVQLTVRLYPNRPQDWAKRARKDPDGWADTVQCIDLGNCEKVLSDALNGVAWTDDKQLHEIRLQRMDPDERGARVEVEIAPIVRQAIAPGLF